jgi:hypothetical protein
VALRDRELAWEGCLNVRDLGGHRMRDGRQTGYGAVVRADSVRQLTDPGWEALLARSAGLSGEELALAGTRLHG